MFGEAWNSPVSDGSGQDRRQLRRSAELLNTAGWTVKDGKRVNAKGEPLAVEFLAFERVSEPHHALYIKNLAALGIECDDARGRSGAVPRPHAGVRLRHLDEPDRRCRSRRATRCAPTSPASRPKAKARPTSRGIANPVVDALIDKAIAANDRQSLYIACRALDRVLRGEHYWVAGWYKPSHWIAYWDIFGQPERQAALRARHAGDLVVRRRQGGEARRLTARPQPPQHGAAAEFAVQRPCRRRNRRGIGEKHGCRRLRRRP